MKWIFRAVVFVLALVLMLSWAANRRPLSTQTIGMLSDRLMEFGAIDFVHSSYIGPEQALFSCVREGKTLNSEQSAKYRTAFQAFLLDKQALFNRLDANLELKQDAGMGFDNNVSGKGISGLHDHHDSSASANMSDINQSLTRLKTASFPTRVVLANDIYKDLTDLMVHMAPAVHSVGLLVPGPIPQNLPTDVDGPYRRFYLAMKLAQSKPVNSAEYWGALDDAQLAYAELIAVIQSHIWAENGALAHAFSGGWLSLQTIAPRLSESSPATANRRGKLPCDAP